MTWRLKSFAKSATLAACAGILIQLGIASPASANAPKISHASFTPTGGTPNVEWTPSPSNKYVGTLHSTGAASGLFDLTDWNGVALFTDAPVIMHLDGSYKSYAGFTYPIAQFAISFTYAGAPITVDGAPVHFGDVLLSTASSWPMMQVLSGQTCCYGGVFDSLVPTNYIYTTVQTTPDPTVHHSGGSTAPYPYIDAGQGILSAGFILSDVPEPAAWALMIAGLALTGATLRRRGPARA